MTFQIKNFLPSDIVRDRNGDIGEIYQVGWRRLYVHFPRGRYILHPHHVAEIVEVADGARKIGV